MGVGRVEVRELGLWRTHKPFRDLPFVCLQARLLTSSCPTFYSEAEWVGGRSQLRGR